MTLDNDIRPEGRVPPKHETRRDSTQGAIGDARDHPNGTLGAAGNLSPVGVSAPPRHGRRIKAWWWVAGGIVSVAMWYGIYLAL